MKKSLLILTTFVVFFSYYSHSQKGYLGRIGNVNIGISSNFSFVSFYEDKENNVKLDENSEVFLPKLDLGYSIQKKRTVFDFETRYQMLPNAIQHSMQSVSNVNQELYIKDTTKMRTNVIRLGISFKRFNHVPPIGLYIRYGIGINLMSSKLVSRKNTEGNIYSQGVWEKKDEYSIDNGFSTIGDISLSIGKIVPLSKRLNLNFGVQSNFPLIRFKFNDVNPTLNDPIYRKWLVGRSLFSRNIIEGYVKIHLFH